MLSRRRRRSDFEEIALPHMGALFGAAYRLTRDGRDAEDLVQDAMLRAYRFWDSFEKDSNCKAWLFKILTNTFINDYQRKKRGREILSAAISEQEATDGVLLHERSLGQRTPEEILLDQSLAEPVERALAAIPPDFRLAVVLCDIEGFSYKEIAEIMECPVGTVMSRLYRGRRLLQKQLRSYAVARGIVRDGAGAEPQAQGSGAKPSAPDTAAPDPINIADYRRKN